MVELYLVGFRRVSFVTWTPQGLPRSHPRQTTRVDRNPVDPLPDNARRCNHPPLRCGPVVRACLRCALSQACVSQSANCHPQPAACDGRTHAACSQPSGGGNCCLTRGCHAPCRWRNGNHPVCNQPVQEYCRLGCPRPRCWCSGLLRLPAGIAAVVANPAGRWRGKRVHVLHDRARRRSRRCKHLSRDLEQDLRREDHLPCRCDHHLHDSGTR